MSSPSLTLQCRQCSGVFAAPKVDFTSLVQCPHCATAAPIVEFAALQDSPRDRPEVGQSVSPSEPLPSQPEPTPTPPPPPPKEGPFQVRGKWLQFDCPHCLRPMRLIAEDAGGLVDCAHCGLELVAPDPAIGRGARLSSASEKRVGSLSRFNLRDLRGDQLKHSKSEEEEEGDVYGLFVEDEEEEDAGTEQEEVDPNHALARGATTAPPERKRAIKALEPKQVGRSFRRREVLEEQAIAASDTDWAPQPGAPRSFADSRGDRYGFWIALGVAAVVMAGVFVMVAREAGKSGEVFNDQQMREIQATQREQENRFQASFEAAKQALSSPTWEAFASQVRDPQRVTPLMRSHYATEPYEPVGLKGFHAPISVVIGQLSLHEMVVTDTAGNTRTLVLEESDGGPKIDWELMVGLPRRNWDRLLDERPQTPRVVRAVASRSSVLDKYLADAGYSRDEAVGFRLWHESADSCFAVLPKDSAMATQMREMLEWDKGRKVVVEVSFDPESGLGDRVRIHRLVQSGWVIQ